MTSQLTANVRKSASLIILAQDKTQTLKFDYKALLFQRSDNASFMAKTSVFPGGVFDTADQSSLWLQHFEKFGFGSRKLKDLCVFRSTNGSSEPIFHRESEDSLEKDISLRITAIRETFEEVGVLLCRNPITGYNENNGYGHFYEDFDRKFWQNEIHNNPSKFFTLCDQMDFVPDLWNLHEWSAWQTPSTFKKRFVTAFYTVLLKNIPNLLLEKGEGSDYTWKTPDEHLNAFHHKEILLAPPQLYELSRLLNFCDLDEILIFAQKRQSKGTTINLPVIFKCTDGIVSLFPGDTSYPQDPNASNVPIPLEMSIKEFRDKAQNLHRAESIDSNKTKLVMNIVHPNGQKKPKNFDI